MNKKFKIKALYNGTNRIRTITLIARDEFGIVQQLKSGDYIEPYEIEEILDPPTSDDLLYARGIGVDIPTGASKEDYYALIFKKTTKDSDPNPDLIEYGVNKGIYFSKYRGKRDLYNIIFHALSIEDRIAFFAFSLYRWLSEDRQANLDQHKDRSIFYEFAELQLSNDKFLKSLDNYSGSSLRYFGIIIVDGWEHHGGSVDTIAYKTCAEFLNVRFAIQKTKTKKFESHDNSKLLSVAAIEDGKKGIGQAGESSSGCFGLFFFSPVIFVARLICFFC
jgi:hypothetical protein